MPSSHVQQQLCGSGGTKDSEGSQHCRTSIDMEPTVVDIVDSDSDGDSDAKLSSNDDNVAAPRRRTRGPPNVKPKYTESSSEDEEVSSSDDTSEAPHGQVSSMVQRRGDDDYEDDDDEDDDEVEVIEVLSDPDTSRPGKSETGNKKGKNSSATTKGKEFVVNKLGYRAVDVLLGKDGDKRYPHTGYSRFQDITRECSRKPNPYRRFNEIIQEVQSNGARFLIWNDDQDMWVECASDVVRKKVLNVVRGAVKKPSNRPSTGSKTRSPAPKKQKEPMKKISKVTSKKLDPVEQVIEDVMAEVKSNGATFMFLKHVDWVQPQNDRVAEFICESFENSHKSKCFGEGSAKHIMDDKGQDDSNCATDSNKEMSKMHPTLKSDVDTEEISDAILAPVVSGGVAAHSKGVGSGFPNGESSKEPDCSNPLILSSSEVGLARTPRKAKMAAKQYVEMCTFIDKYGEDMMKEDVEESGGAKAIKSDRPSLVVNVSEGDTAVLKAKMEGSKSPIKQQPYRDIDVLFGKNTERLSETHPGNVRFNGIIAKFENRYRELMSSEAIPKRKGKRKRIDGGDGDLVQSSEDPLEQAVSTRQSKRRSIGGGGGFDKVPANDASKPEPTLVFVQPPEDPHKDFYVEETAHRYHNPPFPNMVSPPPTDADFNGGEVEVVAVHPKDLRPIPPPPPLPELPTSGTCQWSFDEESRVLLADFSEVDVDESSGQLRMDEVDELFFLQMLERNDLTVISEGLVASVDPKQWDLGYVEKALEFEYYHKFRRFDYKPIPSNNTRYVEVDQCISMTVGDYIDYLDRREKVLQREPKSHQQVVDLVDQDDVNVEDDEAMFTFKDDNGKEITVDVGVSSIYMIDFDLGKYLPTMLDNFLKCMLYQALLPGGAHCMMSSVTKFAQPFMGPNMYITPPGGFTHFHQDGHGTVDSGHFCMKGYNEVVMLRRLTERHKQHALWLLTKDRSKENDMKFYDGLYQLPHDDGLGEKPVWPSKESIEDCKRMGYCPSVFTLKPGQLVHINKGRLHAFRKMSNHELPPSDCHSDLRKELVLANNLTKEELCISVAWDWMYRGVTVPGMNREVVSTLECAALNRKHGTMSLAIPEFCLLQTARNRAPLLEEPEDEFLTRPLIGFNIPDTSKRRFNPYKPSKAELFRGLLPGMRFVVDQHVQAMDHALEVSTGEGSSNRNRHCVSLADRPDSYENPERSSVDPYGNSDFFCKLCHKELSNVYYQCYGCSYILSKDFRICQLCHDEKKYGLLYQMHATNIMKDSRVNHLGRPLQDRKYATSPNGICPCKRGPDCSGCTYCYACSCRCHTRFTQHYRFFTKETETELLLRAEKAAKELPTDDATESLVRERLEPKGTVGAGQATS